VANTVLKYLLELPMFPTAFGPELTIPAVNIDGDVRTPVDGLYVNPGLSTYTVLTLPANDSTKDR
jgi:hypothetical protein